MVYYKIVQLNESVLHFAPKSYIKNIITDGTVYGGSSKKS